MGASASVNNKPKDILNLSEGMTKLVDTGEADFKLGVRYQTGLGVYKDEQKAFDCYQTAANQGHVGAQYKLAVLQKRGIEGSNSNMSNSLTRASNTQLVISNVSVSHKVIYNVPISEALIENAPKVIVDNTPVSESEIVNITIPNILIDNIPMVTSIPVTKEVVVNVSEFQPPKFERSKRLSVLQIIPTALQNPSDSLVPPEDSNSDEKSDLKNLQIAPDHIGSEGVLSSGDNPKTTKGDPIAEMGFR